MIIDRKRTVSVEVALPPQFLSDVLTTAVEGGINYWVEVAESVTRASLGDDLEDLSVLSVNDIKVVENDEAPLYTANLDTVHTGILAVLQPGFNVNDTIKGYVLSALLNEEPDAGHIDADAADVIVQAGLFGEVVYG